MNKAEATRQKIIDAAFWQIYVHGFQGVGIRDIAEKAGLNLLLFACVADVRANREVQVRLRAHDIGRCNFGVQLLEQDRAVVGHRQLNAVVVRKLEHDGFFAVV